MTLSLENYNNGVNRVKVKDISNVYMFSILSIVQNSEVSDLDIMIYTQNKASKFVKSKFEDIYEDVGDSLECPICRSKDTFVTMVQLKSLDEPEDILIICKNGVCRKETFLR